MTGQGRGWHGDKPRHTEASLKGWQTRYNRLNLVNKTEKKLMKGTHKEDEYLVDVRKKGDEGEAITRAKETKSEVLQSEIAKKEAERREKVNEFKEKEDKKRSDIEKREVKFEKNIRPTDLFVSNLDEMQEERVEGIKDAKELEAKKKEEERRARIDALHEEKEEKKKELLERAKEADKAQNELESARKALEQDKTTLAEAEKKEKDDALPFLEREIARQKTKEEKPVVKSKVIIEPSHGRFFNVPDRDWNFMSNKEREQFTKLETKEEKQRYYHSIKPFLEERKGSKSPVGKPTWQR